MTKIPLTDLSLIIFSISQKFKFDYFLKNCHFYALYSRSMSAILIEDFHGYGLNTCLCLKFSLEKGMSLQNHHGPCPFFLLPLEHLL